MFMQLLPSESRLKPAMSLARRDAEPFALNSRACSVLSVQVAAGSPCGFLQFVLSARVWAFQLTTYLDLPM